MFVPTVVVGLLTAGVAVATRPDGVAGQPVATPRAAAPKAPSVTAKATPKAAQAVEPVKAVEPFEAVKTAKSKAATFKKAKAATLKKAKAAQFKKAKAAESTKAKARAKAAVAVRRAAARRTNALTARQLRVSGHRFARVALNVRSKPRASARLVTVLDAGSRIPVTRTTSGRWRLVIVRGHGRWVRSRYLLTDKPEPKPQFQQIAASASQVTSATKAAGLSMDRCPSGSKMERGLKRDAIRVHRAVCARFPKIKTYYGARSSSGYHGSGRAVDVMIPSNRVGWQVARWVRANRKRLGVSEVIFARKIWTVQRSGEGWRSMSDRGNKTANHYDHVHVSVYGNRGSS